MSLFVTGIDTDVGKTFITAGLASCIHEMGVDVGVMKPFAAADRPQKKGFKSKDVEILCNAAKVTDAEELVNPQFFPVPASPYTASKILGTKPLVSPCIEGVSKIIQTAQDASCRGDRRCDDANPEKLLCCRSDKRSETACCHSYDDAGWFYEPYDNVSEDVSEIQDSNQGDNYQ